MLPAFELERLREIDPEHLIYESVKPGPGGSGSVSLMLTPMQLSRITVPLDIEPDEDDPSAQLSACDESGDELERGRGGGWNRFQADAGECDGVD